MLILQINKQNICDQFFYGRSICFGILKRHFFWNSITDFFIHVKENLLNKKTQWRLLGFSCKIQKQTVPGITIKGGENQKVITPNSDFVMFIAVCRTLLYFSFCLDLFFILLLMKYFFYMREVCLFFWLVIWSFV